MAIKIVLSSLAAPPVFGNDTKRHHAPLQQRDVVSLAGTFPQNGELLGNRLARLLALAAFLGTRLHVLIIGERFARFGTMIAALGTAIGHHGGQRPATRTDLRTGGTAGRTVPTVHQARQVFLLAIGQQMRTVRGTQVARPLAVGAGFGTLLQLLIDLHFRRLGLIGERIHADDGEGESQRHHTDSAEHSILHEKFPLLKPPLDAGDRNCHLVSSYGFESFPDDLKQMALRKQKKRKNQTHWAKFRTEGKNRPMFSSPQ